VEAGEEVAAGFSAGGMPMVKLPEVRFFLLTQRGRVKTISTTPDTISKFHL
jgi:hypothetical protein